VSFTGGNVALDLTNSYLNLGIDGQFRNVLVAGPNAADTSLNDIINALNSSFGYNVAAAVAGIGCPVIAAINGDALGAGLALALSCDLRFAVQKSSFGVPDIERGYFLASGITQWLPRIVGRGKAMEMILTAELLDASEAQRIGLVHRVVEPDEVIPQAEKLATEIVSKKNRIG
jgi:enoyl-CoA hydratase